MKKPSYILRFVQTSPLLLLLTLSCGESPNFFHHVVPQKPKTYERQHVIKELIGIGSADIVWVIDNSGSMSDEQALVAANTQAFMDNFLKSALGLDWRMGLISTDVNEPPYIGFSPGDELNFRTVAPADKFRLAVQRLGVNGSGSEEVFNPLRNTFDRYPNFIRDKGLLFIIFVTDETPENGREPVTDFVNYLVSLKGSAKQVSVYGVTPAPESGCRDESGLNRPYRGSRFEEFVQAFSGTHYTVCDSNFGQNIAEIGKSIGERIEKPRIHLKTRPLPGSLQVFFRDQELQGGEASEGGHWIYDLELNAVIFHNLQFASGDNEKVRVIYQEPPEE